MCFFSNDCAVVATLPSSFQMGKNKSPTKSKSAERLVPVIDRKPPSTGNPLRNCLAVLVVFVAVFIGLTWFHSTDFSTVAGGEWSSWDGQQRCRPSTVVQPRTIQEIQSIVGGATRDNKVVRVVGAGHAFNGGALTNDILMNLDHFSSLVSIDSSKKQVTVQAGMRLKNLNSLLAANKLALRQLGQISEQSVAGATQTGTHGTGIGLGNLASQITEYWMVVANGTLIGPINQQQNTELFMAGRVAFGSLGVITQITFQCVDPFWIRKTERSIEGGWSKLIGNLSTLHSAHDQFGYWVMVHGGYARTTTYDVVTQPPAESELRSSFSRYWNEIVMMKVFSFLLRLLSPFPSLYPAFLSAVLPNIVPPEASWVDTSDKNLNGGVPDHYTEMEFFLEPHTAGVKAINEIVQLVSESQSGPAPYTTNMPMAIRYVARDEMWLSQQYQRDSLVISVSVYRNQPAMIHYSKMVEAVSLKYGGRPHWGKLTHGSDRDYAKQFPKWKDFLALRQALDPRGTFVNEYVARVLGVSRPAAK